MPAAITRILSQTPTTGARPPRRPASGRIALVALLTLLALLSSGANALALGNLVNVGTPYEVGNVSSAVDSAGDAVLAWSNTKDLPPATANFVQYCVLPVGATACAHSGELKPADKAEYIDNVQVLVDGATIVVLADVYGAAGASATEYEPEQEWQSTDGGATWTVVDGGKSVANGTLSADTVPLSAVIVPGTGELGYGWDSAASFNPKWGAAPTFDAFPLAEPPVCSEKSCPADETFAGLEPPSNPDQLGNEEGHYASQLGVNSGILAIFATNFSNGPLGCREGFGTAYTYGSGPQQSASNSYDISPGEPGSAWKVSLTQADCNVEYPTVAGGPSGFGILEDNEGTSTTIYHRFDPNTDKFDTAPVTVAGEFEEQPALSQDASGGVYATYLAGAGGEVRLAYSYDGGTTWSGPASLNPDTEGRIGDLTSSVNALGQGWVAWFENGSLYAQSFTAADSVALPAPDTITTTQSVGGASGANIAISAGTVGESDQATIAGENASVASGTVTYGLYSAAGCPAPSEVFKSATAAVTGGLVGASSPVTAALAPGTYYWKAEYSGNAGNDLGAKGNDPATSSCGDEVLTVLPPGVVASGAYTIKTIEANPDGTITITIIPAQAGAATLTVTVPTASIASVSAQAAKKSGKCKHGEVKIKGRCRPASTAVGKTSGKGTAGIPLKLVVHLSGKIRSLLRKGKTVHLSATLSYVSALGGKATVHTYAITVRGHRKKKH